MAHPFSQRRMGELILGSSTKRWFLPGRCIPAGWMVAFVAVAVLDVVCVGVSLWKPVPADWTAFLAAAEGVAETGKPIVYQGEHVVYGVASSWRQYGDSRYELGLWHPPLYVYTLGAGFTLFGSNPLTARLPGILSLVGTVVATMLLSRRLASPHDRERATRVSVLAAILLLLNPLTVQYAVLLPDIDGTLLTLFTVVFVYLVAPYAAAPDVCRPITRLALGAGLAVLIWTKLTTPAVLLVGWSLWYILRRNWGGLSLVAAVSGTGIAIFAATWLVYCWALSLFPLYPIYHNFGRSDIATRPDALGALIHGFRIARFDITWIGVPLALLCALGVWHAFVSRTGDESVDRGRQFVAVVVVVGYVVYTFWAIQSGLLPRYKFPFVPLAAALAANVAYDYIRQVPLRTATVVIVAVALVCSVLPDRLLVAWGGEGFGNEITGAQRWFVWVIAVLLPWCTAAVCLAVARRAHLSPMPGMALCIAAALLAFAGESAMLSLKQSLAPYDTTLYYGNSEYSQVISFLQQHYDPSSVVVYAHRDIGYYWHGRFIDSDAVPLRRVIDQGWAQVVVLQNTEAHPQFTLIDTTQD